MSHGSRSATGSWWFVSLVLVACSSSPVPSPPREGVREVLAGELWTDERCTEQAFQYCLTAGHSISVVSVRVDGARLGVLLVGSQQHLILATSEDRGATWTLVSIDDDDFSRGGQVYRGGMDLFMSGGSTWIYVPRPEEGAGGRTYSRGYLYTVDSAGKLVAATGNLPGALPIDARDGKAFFLVPDRDFRGGPPNLLAVEVDPRDPTAQRTALLECAVPGCNTLSAGAFQGSDDGESYWGFTNTPAGYDAECLVGFSRSRQALGYRCVPRSDWPAAAASEKFAVLPYAGLVAPVLRVFDAQGHAWAVTIVDSGTGDPPTVSAPVDLGPGEAFTNGSFSGRPRHAGLAIVIGDPADSAASARLVQVPQGAPAQDVLLPRSPCVDAATCGDRQSRLQQVYGQVAWTEPLGQGEYLVLYLHDAEPALNRYRPVISASIERPALRDVTPVPFETAAGPVGYVGSVEAGAVERMCVRALSCLGGQGGMNEDISACLHFWLATTAATAAEQRAARLDFLASPADDCRAFRYARDVGFGGGGCRAGCPQSGGHCAADAGPCTFPAAPPADCNRCTADGKAISCTGTTVTRLLDCAAVGQTCGCTQGTSGECLDAPTCRAPVCTDLTGRCTGDVYSWCEGQRDCGVAGLTCTLERGLDWASCKVAEPIPASAECFSTAAQCDGKYLLLCVGGRLTWTDCQELGYRTCGNVPLTNAERCQN
ncbi:MAG: hypothetical protein Q8L48_39710 [Archangium sp.]|nr:hypothetical protein [Archangium sp.]